jgi:hypothetical protein
MSRLGHGICGSSANGIFSQGWAFYARRDAGLDDQPRELFQLS